MAISMQVYRTDVTPIPSFTLQKRDWKPLGNIIANQGEAYDDVLYELATLFRVNPAPANTDPLTVTTLTVGLLCNLFEPFYPTEGLITSGGRTRFIAAITAAAVAVPALSQMIIDKGLQWDERVQEYEAGGGKRLRRTG